MRITTYSPYWQAPAVKRDTPRLFRINSVEINNQHYMLVGVKHHIVQEGEKQEKPFVLSFCFSNDYSCYKWSPLFSHTIRDNILGFVGEDGQIFFLAQDKLRTYDETVVRKYISKINRDWIHSDNAVVVPFTKPRFVNLAELPR